jgi:hypothetical protein
VLTSPIINVIALFILVAVKAWNLTWMETVHYSVHWWDFLNGTAKFHKNSNFLTRQSV